MIKKFNNYIGEANESDPFDEEIWDDSKLPEEKKEPIGEGPGAFFRMIYPQPVRPPKLPYTDLQQLEGLTVQRIDRPRDADEGIIVTFTNGTTLYIGYSGEEGLTRLNNVEIEYDIYDENGNTIWGNDDYDDEIEDE